MNPPIPHQPENPHDQPAATTEGKLTPLLTAWDLAHPTVDDPEWRHLLDEITHPRTTQAFQHLATTA